MPYVSGFRLSSSILLSRWAHHQIAVQDENRSIHARSTFPPFADSLLFHPWKEYRQSGLIWYSPLLRICTDLPNVFSPVHYQWLTCNWKTGSLHRFPLRDLAKSYSPNGHRYISTCFYNIRFLSKRRMRHWLPLRYHFLSDRMYLLEFYWGLSPPKNLCNYCKATENLLRSISCIFS